MSSHRRRHRSWLRWVLVAAAAVVVLAVGVPFAYIHFIEGPAPAPLGLGATASPGTTGSGQATADTPLAGTPAQVVAKLGVFGALGASRMYLQVLDLHDLDHLELIAAEVMPQVR